MYHINIIIQNLIWF